MTHKNLRKNILRVQVRYIWYINTISHYSFFDLFCRSLCSQERNTGQYGNILTRSFPSKEHEGRHPLIYSHNEGLKSNRFPDSPCDISVSPSTQQVRSLKSFYMCWIYTGYCKYIVLFFPIPLLGEVKSQEALLLCIVESTRVSLKVILLLQMKLLQKSWLHKKCVSKLFYLIYL